MSDSSKSPGWLALCSFVLDNVYGILQVVLDFLIWWEQRTKRLQIENQARDLETVVSPSFANAAKPTRTKKNSPYQFDNIPRKHTSPGPHPRTWQPKAKHRVNTIPQRNRRVKFVVPERKGTPNNTEWVDTAADNVSYGITASFAPYRVGRPEGDRARDNDESNQKVIRATGGRAIRSVQEANREGLVPLGLGRSTEVASGKPKVSQPECTNSRAALAKKVARCGHKVAGSGVIRKPPGSRPPAAAAPQKC